ncbi:hypothetical protein RclHR1_22850005 [Rhizophagus clarus]|uniref:Reverse transcriptase domain-containing protein n=1 Tax=Rhizophagus clarus TaxID=94130 RepID=A0A2Z6R8F0_9GLOM|nr:hypothetical protein RclHR1_22850005 [Rhizophagus clarus]
MGYFYFGFRGPATHNVLTGGNFAGLPGGTCRDPIITLESIIYDANHNKSPLWILSQDISKAFDSINLTILKFALERIRLPASAIILILSLFTNCSNWVFTVHGDTQVRIGIDQGEVISLLLWVIYINPLLTVLNKEMMDPYILRSPTLLPHMTDDSSNIAINNLVFMDDSTLISSSKVGLKHMLSITEEFYMLNNTSANHQKYVLISNLLPLTTTSTISPVDFDLQLSTLNRISSISVTPISITFLFRFLGVWFNLTGSCDFIKKQIASECNSFAATLRLARLSAQQVVYLYNTVLIPKLEYRMQVTHLSEKDCHTATRSIQTLVKHKANFSRSFPNSILYLSQALGLINLFSHMMQCHIFNPCFPFDGGRLVLMVQYAGVKVKGHNRNYWNEFADYLASSVHHSDDAYLLPVTDYTFTYHVRLAYDNVICESNPRRLLKLYYQSTFMKDLLSLNRFQFTFYLCNRDDYVIDWEFTWFTLNFSPVYDASFQAHHASRHFTFKFKLFLDELFLLERLKITRPDLYIDLLTYRSCCDRKEDLMHLILCFKRCLAMHQILQTYQNHLFFKLREAGELADTDSTPMLRRLSSLSCWTISSANWSSYALI